MLVRQRWIELSIVVGSGGTLVPLYVSLLTTIFTLVVVAHYEGLTVLREAHRHALYVIGRSCHGASELLLAYFLSYSVLSSLHINFHRFALYLIFDWRCRLRQWHCDYLYLVWYRNLSYL